MFLSLMGSNAGINKVHCYGLTNLNVDGNKWKSLSMSLSTLSLLVIIKLDQIKTVVSL